MVRKDKWVVVCFVPCLTRVESTGPGSTQIYCEPCLISVDIIDDPVIVIKFWNRVVSLTRLESWFGFVCVCLSWSQFTENANIGV